MLLPILVDFFNVIYMYINIGAVQLGFIYSFSSLLDVSLNKMKSFHFTGSALVPG